MILFCTYKIINKFRTIGINKFIQVTDYKSMIQKLIELLYSNNKTQIVNWKKTVLIVTKALNVQEKLNLVHGRLALKIKWC